MEIFHNKNIVFAVIIAMLVEQTFALPPPENIRKIKKMQYEICMKKYPMPKEMVNKMIFYIMTDSSPEDRIFKCYMKCALEEISAIDNKGVINGEALISFAHNPWKEPTANVVKSCLPTKGGMLDGCETAYNFVTCATKIDPKIIVLLLL